MKRYYKGTDIPFKFSIKDKNGKIIPLACFDSLGVVFRTTGEQYTKYYKGGGITENEDGTYRIYANENAFGLLPDGLLKYTVSFTVNGIHQEIKECETDIFIKTPKQFQPKANVQDKSITITENNSTSSVIPDGGYEGLGKVTINVEIPFPLEVKAITLTENGEYEILPDGGYEGMSKVNVSVNCDAESFYVKFLRKEASGKIELPIEAMNTPNCLYGQTGITEVVVPEGTTSIPNGFFQYCTSLAKITYPDTITSFGENIYIGIDIEKRKSFPLPPYLNSSLTGIYYRDGEVFNVPKYINQFGKYSNPSYIDSYNDGIAKRLNFKGNLYRFYSQSFRAEEVDFRHNVQVPKFDGWGTSIYTGMTKVIVPESLYDTWITTSPWSNYADITESVPDTDYFIPYQTKSGDDIALTTGVKENRYAVISYTDKKIHLRGTPWNLGYILGTDVTYVDFAASDMEVPDFSNLLKNATQMTGCTLPKNKPLSCVDMCYDCQSLITIPPMDTSLVSNMNSMFYQCYLLTTIPEMDTSKVVNMYQMFCHCHSLTAIPPMNTSRVTDMVALFAYCYSLTTIPELDTSNIDSTYDMFYGCEALTDLGGLVGLKCNLDLSPCTALAHDSIMNVINKAADVTSSPVTLTLGSTNLAKLSDAEKAIATSKGWTLA